MNIYLRITLIMDENRIFIGMIITCLKEKFKFIK